MKTFSNPLNAQVSVQSWIRGIRVVDLGILFLILCTLVLRLAYTEVDVDLWGHLRFGLDTLAAKQIIRQDSFSYTAPNHPWINHEWLSEVLFALSWNIAGSTGLILLKIGIWLVTLSILLGYMLYIGLKPIRASIVLLLIFILMLPATGTVRPHMFTALGFCLTLMAIVLADGGKYNWLWILPVVFALWANLHGGMLAGLLVLIVWMVLSLVTNPKRWKQILPPVAASVLATMLNPYGPQLLIFLLRTATVQRPDISEWAPLPIQSLIGVVYLLIAGLTLFILHKNRLENKLTTLVVIGIMIVLPLVAQRHVVLFAIAVPLLTGKALLEVWPGNSKKSTISGKVLLPVSIFLGLVMLLFSIPRLHRIVVKPEFNYPINAVELLKISRSTGNLAVHFNWGEYVIWHLSPSIKVSVDGRRETVYNDEVLKQNLRLLVVFSDWEELLDKYPTDLVLLPNGSPGDSVLQLHPDWQLIYQDQASALHARKGGKSAEVLLEALPSFNPKVPSGEFP